MDEAARCIGPDGRDESGGSLGADDTTSLTPTTVVLDRPSDRSKAQDRAQASAQVPRSLSRSSGLIVVALLALVPIVVLLFRSPFHHWTPVGDVATAGLRTAEVGTSHTPLVGPYSHFGWAHPGPLLYEILAVPYRLLGGRTAGLLVGALLINALAIVIVVSRLFRTFGLAVAFLGAAVFGMMTWSLGTSLLWYPWNPNLCVLPFAALIVVTWTTARNSRWDLPLLALLGSFVAQTHVAYVPFVAVLVPLALLGRKRRIVPGDDDRAPLRTRTEILLGGAVLVVLWLPTAIDAIANDGGNVRKILDFWASGKDTAGLRLGLRIVSYELSSRPPWLGFDEPLFIGTVAPRGTPIPVAFIAVLVAAFFAWRARDRLALRAALIVVAITVVAVFAVANIVGFVLPYLIWGVSVVAAANWLVVGLVLVRRLDERLSRTTRGVTTGVCAALAVLVTVMLTVTALTTGIGPTAEHRDARPLGRVAARVLPQLPPGGAVRVESSSTFAGGTDKVGLMLQLLQHGHAVTSDRGSRLPLGDHYVGTRAEAPTTLVLATGAQEYDQHRASHRLLAVSGTPVKFPAGAPVVRPGEAPYEYLARVRGRVDELTYRRLKRYLVDPFPVAVFATRDSELRR
ncbi:MAG TPA: hypothetical protein VK549_09135 [Acidimicrobiia bacterium]|nr:hypothetical protein [Acidimicrobiia bacterium]